MIKKDELQKLIVSKNDEIAVIVEKIIDSSAKEIVLNIPKFSKLAESIANFQLIKREAEILNKKIIVESVDDQVLEFASFVKLDSFNPIFLNKRKRISDIVSDYTKKQKIKEDYIKAEEESAHLNRLGQQNSIDDVADKTAARVEQRSHGVSLVERLCRLLRGFLIKRLSMRKFLFVIGCLVLLLIVVLVCVILLPKADIVIYAKTFQWDYLDTVSVLKSGKIDQENNYLPGERFTQTKSKEFLFLATGKKHIERKATGELVVYNAYSSDPQILVATTRFMDSAGKIFRLTNAITVPGAKIIDGKIVPLSIKVFVEADKPGSDYNIGQTAHLSIPGFKGSAKYSAFYAESKESMSGGFIGDIAYPTESDVKNAKGKAQSEIKSELMNLLQSQVPSEFKILNNGEDFQIVSLVVSDKIDANNNFKIDLEAKISAMAFKESDLKDLMLKKAREEYGDQYDFKSYKVEYGAPITLSSNKDVLKFAVRATSVVAAQLNINNIKPLIAGKKTGDVKSVLFSLPNVEKVQISLWPFWVGKIPSRLSRINILIQ